MAQIQAKSSRKSYTTNLKKATLLFITNPINKNKSKVQQPINRGALRSLFFLIFLKEHSRFNKKTVLVCDFR